MSEQRRAILDYLRRIYGVKTDQEVIARALKIALAAAKATGGGNVDPCEGCDGHECDTECQYPGVVSEQLTGEK